MIHVEANREDYLIAWLAAIAIGIHILESSFPMPVPGIKPGFANIITVASLILFGWKTAAWVSCLRVLVGSLVIGSFLTPTFVLSVSGALASLSVLLIASNLPGVKLGPVGYCVLAAIAHMLAQITMAYLLFIPHDAIFGLLPILMTAAVIFGVISGYITKTAIETVEHYRA